MDGAPHEQILVDASQVVLKIPALKLVFISVWPVLVSGVVYCAQQFISMYFLQAFVIPDQPYILVVLFAGITLFQAFPGSIWEQFSQIASQTLFVNDLETADNLNLISINLSICWTVISLIIFYPICYFVVTKYNMPETIRPLLYTTFALTGPFSALTVGQEFRYQVEERVLLGSSITIFLAIIFISIEMFLYVTFFPSSAWPTAVAYVLTNVLISTWTVVWNQKVTVLGIKNKTIITTTWKDIANFKKLKGFLHQMGQFYSAAY
uniref:Transmembrane domain-containing protein n=1 Tax=Spironucleus salmonicida TaxID=348837 RepID=V6LR30_9EUKA|eukprot:EST46683.1 Transmembrane domain-containing protein [Spironucleus salmonicida]